jgi:hypothetical protein
MSTMRINRNLLFPDGVDYIELHGVVRVTYGVARPQSGSLPSTYRNLPEITAVYATPDLIPTDGELFRTATKVTRYSDALIAEGAIPWEHSDRDWIFDFPLASVFLMLLATDDFYRQQYPDAANAEQSIIVE